MGFPNLFPYLFPPLILLSLHYYAMPDFKALIKYPQEIETVQTESLSPVQRLNVHRPKDFKSNEYIKEKLIFLQLIFN